MTQQQPNFGNNLEDESTKLPGDESAIKMEPALINEPKQAVQKVDVLKKYAKRVWLVLEENDNIPPTGQFFGHNGTGFMLRAGIAVQVPIEILNILNDAVTSAPVVDPATKQIVEYRPRLRFPYRIVAAPVAEARAA